MSTVTILYISQVQWMSNIPHSDKFDCHGSAERLFETLCDGDAGGVCLLEQLVSEWYLLRVVLGEQPNLFSVTFSRCTK